MTIIRPAETGISEALEKASGTLKAGGVIAYPTETFYGLGVKFDNIAALKKLCGIKDRPRNKALPLIIGEKRALKLIASSITASAEKLIQKFWPGPLMLLLPARPDISELLTATTGKIAVRVPGESFALELVRSLGFPITATSANISGMPPADNADDVVRYFGDALDLIIDCGETPGGKPSTIVDASEEKTWIVRAGAILPEEVFAVL
ncbi:MAG: threonylcarbamoyl-AMP synthase [Nitrospira bacterium HGW-Nitrospira-1]|nr:MAG: threonylcarbamoyl-AMP synthase [Nitrospira bacterium HGW-Nitrospira-1]